MARGAPDYKAPDYQVAIEQNDLSIMALVEGGFTFLDGKGRIVWYDNFKQGLSKWNIGASGGGETPQQIVSQAFSYGFYGSVVLNPVVNGGQADMSFNQNISFGKRVGIEVYARLAGNHGRVSIVLGESPDNGAAYLATMYIEETTGDLFIDNNGVDVRIFDNPDNAYISDFWNNVKLVGDFSTGKYYKAVIGGNVIDLSSYSMVASSTGIKGRVALTLKNVGKPSSKTGQAYIGGVFISVDEP